jgi:hypothetical protein
MGEKKQPQKKVTLDEEKLDRWLEENQERIREYDRRMRIERKKNPLSFPL